MRNLFFGAIVGLGLAISTSGAHAAFINFVESADETGLVDVSTNLVLTAPIVTTPESATVMGFHHPGISPSPLETGRRAAALFEPGDPNMVSDYVLLTAFDIRGDLDFGLAQDLIIQFFSIDILLGDLLAQLSLDGFTFGGGLEEDGTLQDLSLSLGTLPEGLIVGALSHAGEAIPEPASLALLGLGLVGLGYTHRRRLFSDTVRWFS